MREFYLPSTGGGKLYCGIWASLGKPRAVLQLVHGIAEHIGRYDGFGAFLAEQGIVMVADDHMGHGRSVEPGEPMGFLKSGWLGAVDDELHLMGHVREAYPDIPYFLMGHSMGSFLARTFLYRHAESGISGAILSGTGWQPPAVLAAGLWLCDREARKYGETATSDLLQRLIFGAYNRKFPDARTPHDWICSDPDVVNKYAEDPLCGFSPTIGLARDMLQGIRMNQKKKNLESMRKELPVFFFSGAQDPVGDMGRGVRRSVRAFRRAGMQDVSCRLYENGRHEMLNEPNHEAVYADILQWLDGHGLPPK